MLFSLFTGAEPSSLPVHSFATTLCTPPFATTFYNDGYFFFWIFNGNTRQDCLYDEVEDNCPRIPKVYTSQPDTIIPSIAAAEDAQQKMRRHLRVRGGACLNSRAQHDSRGAKRLPGV